ncbi:chitinase [Sinosporangium album]|uniref:chitinase n=1 Tax=Sinosporangium album TaxID=504805 RepID=A0A1G8H2Z7_9ACTN|nr:glycosyl hydrolase family 18 protein [Sinosporangium album]SDI00986.1 chitinase [Sinosporangium album]
MKRRTLKQFVAATAVLAMPLTAAALTPSTAFAMTGVKSVMAAAAPWAPNTAYTVGTRVTYNGVEYECRQNHTSLVGWEPSNVPALWKVVDGGGPNDPTAPSVPGNFRSTAKTSTTIDLAWNASTDNVGVTGYEIYRGTGTTPIATVTTGTTYKVTGLTANTEYTFTVKAKDAAGNASAAAGPLIVKTDQDGTNDPTAPSKPGNLRSTGKSTTTVDLAWNASTDNVGVTGYDIFRGTGTTPIATATGTTHKVTGLTPNTEYTFTVKAKDAAGNSSDPSDPVTVRTNDGPPPPPGDKLMGYFVNWGIYQRNYHVKNIDTSGSAAKLTHINYAFANVSADGRCIIGDSWADYEKAYTAAESVDGVADTWDQPLRGNFNQLRKLKAKHPNLKVLFSVGGWTWSNNFGAASRNATAFAESCYNLVEDPRWADVFDGIDIDWEYPNACGLICDTSGPASFKNLMQAVRAKFGQNNLVTAAITADGTPGGKIDAADYGGASQYVDWYNVMTYDFFGAWAKQGPTAPHSPLRPYDRQPIAGFDSDTAIQKLKTKGVPANKLLLGIGFYGRGWTGVTQDAPGGTATDAAPGTYEPGFEDYKILKDRCPSTGTIGGTAYAKCNNQWWGYDTPATIAGKMTYAKGEGLGGSFFWELSGDTANGELITAMKGGAAAQKASAKKAAKK